MMNILLQAKNSKKQPLIIANELLWAIPLFKD